MSARALRLCLAVLLAAPAAGCGAGPLKKIYAAAAYKMSHVPTEAMAPTIRPGAYIAIDESYYRKRPVERFDVVTFTLPEESIPREVVTIDTETVIVSRVVGLGGETVEVRGGRVYVNGHPLEEPFETAPLPPRDRFGPVAIPEGHLFLMGDNRPNSLDGRYWARPTLPARFVRGKVVEIFHE